MFLSAPVTVSTARIAQRMLSAVVRQTQRLFRPQMILESYGSDGWHTTLLMSRELLTPRGFRSVNDYRIPIANVVFVRHIRQL